jgi:D-beta-D-heptose 7-phosphate kinase/D-beta-D-heptose 1-phosphate adenosyltransferase
MNDPADRIIAREELGKFRGDNSGRAVVFTNGCFDILHKGHITLLEKARAMGDCLVVGVNSDDSVRRLKGEERPINTALDRAEVLLALRSVDYVTIFGEDTPIETIEALEPDVLVKGAEYGSGEIVGEDFVLAGGGRVERIEMVKGYSTSGIIEKMPPEDE